MFGIQTSLTPTEAAAHARRREFRRKIAAQAVPDTGILLRPAPKQTHVAPEPPPKPPGPEEWIARQTRIHPPIKTWFEVISESALCEHRGPTISEIQAVVADYFSVTRAALTGPRRTRDIVRPRQIAIYLAKTITQRSLPEIGRRFGYRDHSTALHSVRQITKLCKVDLGIAYDVAQLEAQFQ